MHVLKNVVLQSKSEDTPLRLIINYLCAISFKNTGKTLKKRGISPYKIKGKSILLGANFI